MKNLSFTDLRVEITDKGFSLYKLNEKDEYEKDEQLSYGDITCKYLNEEYFKSIKVINNDLSKAINHLGPPIIEIVTDREHFASHMPAYSLWMSNKISITYFYDNTLNKGVGILTVNDWKDLLGCDLCKILEYGVIIKKCACCEIYFPSKHPKAKYCKKHQEEGARRTKYANVKNDRCASLAKKIYNRLYRNEDYHDRSDRTYVLFSADNGKYKSRYRSGSITEQQYYDWLLKMDTKTRRHNKKDNYQ